MATNILPWWGRGIFSRRAPDSAGRQININLPLPHEMLDRHGQPAYTYPSNNVRTAKYTLVTFLPKNMFEQFRRIANSYFLVMIIIQTLPALQLSATPWLPAIPLVVIIGITALKDAVEDMRRHRSDRQLNSARTHVLKDANNANFPQRPKPIIMKRRINVQDNDQKTNAVKKLTAVRTTHASSFMDGWVETSWDSLRMGDYVLLRANDPIPADILILATSFPEGIAFIETKSLDGETNLKAREAVRDTMHFRSASDLLNLKAIVNSEPPNLNLYSYSGTFTLKSAPNPAPKSHHGDHPSGHVLESTNQHPTPISIQNILLRGCVLRNTEYVIGLVLFTGEDTKIIMNSGKTPSKRSRIEITVNYQIACNFAILFFMAAIITSLKSTHDITWSLALSAHASGFTHTAIIFAATIIMLQNIVPISLYVTIELIKSTLALFIYSDDDMLSPETGERCIPKSWNITDDLGQIEYLFSDKTGTLTQNKMELRRCSINGVVYGQGFTDVAADKLGLTLDEQCDLTTTRTANMLQQMATVYRNPHLSKTISFIDDIFYDHYINDPQQRNCITRFFTLLAICHTVPMPQPHPTEMLHYSAQSPDETALVLGAKNVGFIFESRESNAIIINVQGVHQRFEILHVLEFNSTRKRGSVIVRDSQGQILLLTKGADNVIYKRLAAGQDEMMTSTLQHLSSFATEGLRTLCLADRVIPKDEYLVWAEKYRKASLALQDRDQALDDVAELIEVNLNLLGSTAIEDKLQDGVPQTITALRHAGIKIWVLTGDKLETAVNISYAAGLISTEMTLLIISATSFDQLATQLDLSLSHLGSTNGHTWSPPSDSKPSSVTNNTRVWTKSVMQMIGRLRTSNQYHASEQPKELGLAIDGESLAHVFTSPETLEKFLYLSTSCKSVICCRVSPKQKAQVVQLVKQSLNVMCMSIGDGANDVSMIQEAHVGVGISGKEGPQAAMAADFAIGQFRFLQKLMLVHGHWSYYRISECILNFFFKNMTWVFALFWYQIHSGFTAVLLYDYNYVLLFNILFTSLPPIIIGALDKDASESQIKANPHIYTMGIRQLFFNFKRFWGFVLDACFQSLIAFRFAIDIFSDTNDASGQPADRLILGTVTALFVIIAINVSMAFNVKSWNVLSIIGMVLSALSFIVYVPLWSILVSSSSLVGVGGILYRDPRLYLGALLCTVACVLPRFTVHYMRSEFWPSDLDVVRGAPTHMSHATPIENKLPVEHVQPCHSSILIESTSPSHEPVILEGLSVSPRDSLAQKPNPSSPQLHQQDLRQGTDSAHECRHPSNASLSKESDHPHLPASYSFSNGPIHSSRMAGSITDSQRRRSMIDPSISADHRILHERMRRETPMQRGTRSGVHASRESISKHTSFAPMRSISREGLSRSSVSLHGVQRAAGASTASRTEMSALSPRQGSHAQPEPGVRSSRESLARVVFMARIPPEGNSIAGPESIHSPTALALRNDSQRAADLPEAGSEWTGYAYATDVSSTNRRASFLVVSGIPKGAPEPTPSMIMPFDEEP